MSIKLNSISNHLNYSFFEKSYSSLQNKIIGVALLALTALASALLTAWFLKSKVTPIENVSEKKSIVSQDVVKKHLDPKISEIEDDKPISNHYHNQSNVQIQPYPKPHTPKKSETKKDDLWVKGKIIDKDGAVYTGFSSEKLDGQGVKTMKDGGIVYKGEFKNGKLNGQGEIIDNYWGKFFKGHFVDDELNGTGEKNVYDCVYKGEFLNNELHGEGTYHDYKYVYNGLFMYDKFHGKGKLILDDGAVLNGDFLKGEFKNGTRTNPDGTIYEGKFSLQELSGEGTETTKDGIVYKGNFVEGRLVGQGTKTTKDGQVQAGVFSYNVEKKCYDIT